MHKAAAKKAVNKPVKRKAVRVRPEPIPSARGEETRARLLDAAFEEFRNNGYHGTSMRRIAQAAGLAVGGIYNHFHSKEEIFAAVFDARHPYHEMLPALAAARGETLEEFVHEVGRRWQASMLGAADELLPLLFIEIVEFQGQHLQALAERLFPKVMELAQAFVGQKGHRRDLPLPVVLRTFISLLIGYLMTDLFIQRLPVFKSMEHDWFNDMLDIYLHGTVAPGTTRPGGIQAAEA